MVVCSEKMTALTVAPPERGHQSLPLIGRRHVELRAKSLGVSKSVCGKSVSRLLWTRPSLVRAVQIWALLGDVPGWW